jgi:SpoVK/Ycf46/Vps4 family AAA+-type ATPase
MLTNVHTINQKEFKAITKFAIRAGGNVLVLGPSGGGKTIIAKDAASEEKCRMIYVNLSVLERTDFQGFPVISDDRSLVSYATPDFLPFADTSTRDEKSSLLKFKETLNSDKDASIIKYIDESLNKITQKENAKALVHAAPYIQKAPGNAIKRIQELAKHANSVLGTDEPIVFLFDEVDKAATETTQTLLELLQFGSINGRKLNVKASILTGNMPDEHAHTSQISHAISKRCASYQLDLDFNMWREWAFKNGVHDHIIQFLSNEAKWLYQKAPDGDVTAYALPSPRTWTEAAKQLMVFDKDPEFSRMPEEKALAFKMNILSGHVGDGAAAKYRTWFQYYRRFDPAIRDLVENGKHPDTSKLTAQEILILAIASCSRVYSELKPGNKKKIESVTKNVYKWMDTLQSDAQMGAVRLSFGGDWENCHKFGLPQIPEFVKVFKSIKKKMGDWESDLSPQK